MKTKILNTFLTGAALVTMGVATTQAATLDDVSGDVKFLYDGWNSAQTSYDSTVVGTLCATIGDCDTESGAANAPGSNQTNDTWGYTDVSGIKNIGSPVNAWNAGDDGDLLIAYFFGFNDVKVEILNATSVNVFSVGGFVDIYRVDLNFRLNVFDTTDQATIEATLAGQTKYLELEFDTGCSMAEPLATLCGNFDFDNMEGDSNGFAHATGGDGLSKYPFDFQFEQSVEPCNGTCDNTSFNLLVRSGSAITTALPEPASLGLLGLGLVGMGLLGRRRKAA